MAFLSGWSQDDFSFLEALLLSIVSTSREIKREKRSSKRKHFVGCHLTWAGLNSLNSGLLLSLVCGLRISGCLEPHCPVSLLLESHFMSLFRGLCLSGGCVVSEGKKGLRLKLFKSRVEKTKMSHEFVIALPIIGDRRQTWWICWDIQVMCGVLYEP